MSTVADIVAAYAPGSDEPAWLRALRDDAIARFEALGFPTSKLEDWKYTGARVKAIADGSFAPAAAAPRMNGPGEPLAGAIDSLEGRIGSLADAKDDAFVALNTALFDDGAIVRASGQTAEPVRVEFEANGAMTNPRLFVEAAANSAATVVVEFSSSDAACFTNFVFEIDAAANARVDVVLLQRESDSALHVSRGFARAARDARVAVHTLTLGGRLVRNDLNIVLAEEGADATMNGLFLGTGERHVDNHTLVDHAVPHGTSSELYKGVLGDASRGVFRGRVVVRPDAQKTAAEQSNPNLLLSNRAEVDTKPQLEIYADDVRCSHGSTIGQLDRDALFFLRARGIARDAAYRMLVAAFANEVIDELPDVSHGEVSLGEPSDTNGTLADRTRALFAAGLAAAGGDA